MSETTDRFLRSINLHLDRVHPERLIHWRPTRKGTQVLQAIAESKPTAAAMVVAAYGSGKSLAAACAALLVENNEIARNTLETLARRLEAVNPALGQTARNRLYNGGRGCVLVLEGYQPELTSALATEGRARLGPLAGGKTVHKGGVLALLNAIATTATNQGLDRIAIIWDEFGQHLEGLAQDGRAEELAAIQQIAEWAARQSTPAVTFTLILHQSFFNYAGNLSHAARSGWRKIEGRFATLRFVEDSQEMYELIASVIEASRPTAERPPKNDFHQAAASARKCGFFANFENIDVLADTLMRAWPVAPAALYMLPRLAARLAQNERTVFSFIRDRNLTRIVTLKDVYDYFSEAMEVDLGVAGAHRRWLETESALSKVLTAEEEQVIAATALLGLGVSGERVRFGREALTFAVRAYGTQSRATAEATIDALIERKLLLYRQRNDDISVWHGTDVDLRGRLEEEKLRLEAGFDAIPFVSKEHPAPSWRPIEHNVQNRIRRYWTGLYVSARELLREGKMHQALALAPGEDGRVIYTLAGNAEELASLRTFAKKEICNDPGLVLVVPETPVPFHEVALELAALRRLAQDHELIGSDPMVLPELQHMADAAAEGLAALMQRLVSPVSVYTRWFAEYEDLCIRSEAKLRTALSNLADRRFSKTPQITNELVVRQNLSRPMVNARKKVLLGILERTGEAELGFNPEDTTPDVAIYRTVLKRTGLYRQGGTVWRWAEPEELEDEGLRCIWKELKGFFAGPGKDKRAVSLINDLRLPPYGVRAGVIPILVGAALQAFGKALVMRRDGIYLRDILASEIEAFCAESRRFTIDVFDLDKSGRAYLQTMAEQFGGTPSLHGDLVRQCYDAIEMWKAQLPDAALKTRKVSAQAREFQKILRDETDPAYLLLERLPALAGVAEPNAHVAEIVSKVRCELEGIIEGYTAAAIDLIRRYLAIRPGEPGDGLTLAERWSECFADTELPRESLDQTSRALLARAREANSGRYTEASFARAVSTILLGKGFDKWDDRTAYSFGQNLSESIKRIEAAAIEVESPGRSTVPLLGERIAHLYEKLARAASSEEAEELLEGLRRSSRARRADVARRNAKAQGVS